jgi:hypothetical protein
MAVLEPERWAREVTVLDLRAPVESICTCLMPVQKEPRERYHCPPEEMNKLRRTCQSGVERERRDELGVDGVVVRRSRSGNDQAVISPVFAVRGSSVEDTRLVSHFIRSPSATIFRSQISPCSIQMSTPHRIV